VDAKGTVDQRLFRLAFLLLASDDAVAHEGQIWRKERTAMRSTEHGTPEPSEPSPESSPFDKAPWLFQKGNKMGAGRRDMARKRLEHMIQQITRNGEVIVMFFAALASGQPFMMQYVKELEMTDEQKAVAYGIATDAQKAMAKRQRRFVVLRRPYYPNMEEMTAAMNWLAERGFGKAPKTVQIEGSVTSGFKMVFRRWAPGTDPASLPLAEMPKQIVTSARVLDVKPTNGKNGRH